MARVALTDGSGAWFNTDSAVLFKEDTRWNGNNHISVPTGSQWDHEYLYYTKSGKWVKHGYSQWQGSLDTYEQIDEQDAIEWLIQNGHTDEDCLAKLPASVLKSVQEGFAAAEI